MAITKTGVILHVPDRDGVTHEVPIASVVEYVTISRNHTQYDGTVVALKSHIDLLAGHSIEVTDTTSEITTVINA